MPKRYLAPLLAALFLAVPSAARAQEDGVRAVQGGVLVDFSDADLRLVISALAEAGRLNVTFTNLPQRNVTLRLTQPVPAENILPLLRSLVRSNGLRMIEDGGFVRIESDEGAAQGGVDPAGGDAGGAQDTGPRLFVYRLRHATAARLATTLQSLYGGARGVPGRRPRPRTLSEGLRDQAIPPGVPGEPTAVVEINPGAGIAGDVQGEVQIVADEPTNSILVKATAADWQVVRQAIDVLDLRPLQVLIEVLIAEVRRGRDLQVGTNVSASNRHDARPIDLLLGQRPRGADSVGTGALQVNLFNLGSLDVDVSLRALASTGNVRILSRPVLLAQNNLESKLVLGEERPFVQVVRTLPTADAVRDQVVQYRDVGTTLTLTPTINPDGYVNLQLVQEVSNVSGRELDAPIITTREAATHLFVRDGQTVVIGGLIQVERERTRSGIPFLKDIPLLGALFGSTTHRNLNSELFLFLTPHIIRSDDDADDLRQQVEGATPAIPERGPGAVFTSPARTGPAGQGQTTPATPSPAAPAAPAPATPPQP
ncbi:MAG TPA: secretin N-terminal domain-containing protein [Longimicrobium sp.]|nr:secretin N-terminal domain-containing protein [Longimicrobium sp.]